MRTYSIDLRQKILQAYERQLGSQRVLASVFGVNRSFVEKLLRRYRTTGELAPKPHAGGQRLRLGASAQALVTRVVRAQPDATLALQHGSWPKSSEAVIGGHRLKCPS